MNKDTIIKVLLAIIALMVFAWLWRIISGMLIGTLVLRFDADNEAALERIKQTFRTQLLAVDSSLNLPF